MAMSTFTGNYIEIKYLPNQGHPGYTASFMFFKDKKTDHLAILEAFDNMIQWTQDVRIIELGACGLGTRLTSTSLKLLKATPGSVHTIDISWNELSEMNHSDFLLVLDAIPSTVLSINLSWNRLGDKNCNELYEMLRSLHPNISIINLTNNNLGKLSNIQLAAALGGLSRGVTTLYLGRNGLDTKTPEELDIIFQFLPENIHKIYLDNGVYYPQQIKAAKRSMPETSDIAPKRQRIDTPDIERIARAKTPILPSHSEVVYCLNDGKPYELPPIGFADSRPRLIQNAQASVFFSALVAPDVNPLPTARSAVLYNGI